MAVTPADIAVELGRPTPNDFDPVSVQWARWIADARIIIEARLGDPNLLNQDTLDYVVRQAVAAYARNPDSARQVSKSVGQVSVATTFDAGQRRTSITIDDSHWALLDPDFAGSDSFSYQPYGEDDTVTIEDF